MAQPITAESLARIAVSTSILTEEFVETRSVTLEWKVTNLKTLFEQSKGDVKSKCIKSAPFDSNKWQIFFYPNSGHDQYASLYLSCEPTPAEKEKGAMGVFKTKGKAPVPASAMSTNPTTRDADKTPWQRDGKFRFTFEARSLDRRMTFKQMEAFDHSFSDAARNWGYANFIKRSDLYFNNAVVRMADAFLIVCKIVSSPTPPSPPPLPRLLIPKDLVNAYASLFNDPDYSDVCFCIQPEGGLGGVKRLYAAKKVLAGRAEYFDAMFSGGFNESSPVSVSVPPSPSGDRLSSDLDDFDEADYDSNGTPEWDEDDDSIRSDSDVSDSEDASDADKEAHGADDEPYHRTPRPSTPPSTAASIQASDDEEIDDNGEAGNDESSPAHKRSHSDVGSFVDAKSALEPESPLRGARENTGGASPSRGSGVESSTPGRKRVTGEETSGDSPGGRVRAPRGDKSAARSASKAKSSTAPIKAKKSMRQVIITDAAFTTYRALLFWIYTDSITFVPLASTYHVARENAALQGLPFPYPTRRDYILATTPYPAQAATQMPGLCSAKAIYRLADKIGLPELKERAYEHIVKSLTVENIPYEVFGSFSLRFEEVKRVEVAFLCDKWNEVRSSPSMGRVLSGIRNMGRFPGFEDVWARILPNLEYRATLPIEEA